MNPALIRLMTQDVATLVEAFPARAEASKKALRKLLVADPSTFREAAFDVLRDQHALKQQSWAGAGYVADLLALENLLAAGLADRMATNRREAMAIAKSIAENNTCLPSALENTLGSSLREPPYAGSAKRIMDLLDLFAVASSENRLSMFQTQLMEYPDEKVQSKAALLVGGSAKSAVWVGRHVRHEDARVRANAVEALWTLNASDSRTMLAAASGSSHNRVAGNAALGLYRLGDVSAIPLILGMAQREDPGAQLSGLWAMGETQDPRFLTFLTGEFTRSEGRKRLAITRALARIRRREKIIEEAEPIHIRALQASLEPDGWRRIAFTLWSPRIGDLSVVKATEFVLWEGDTPVYDYDVRRPPNPALLVAGFLTPWFVSATEPYADAVADGLNRCLRLKRTQDLWRIDRYSIESRSGASADDEDSEATQGSELVRPGVKIRHGFLSDRDALDEAIRPMGTAPQGTPDSFGAIEQLCRALGKYSAPRHGFIFLHREGNRGLDDPANLTRLRERIVAEQIVLHGFAPSAVLDCAGFRSLCRAIRGGTFIHTSVDQLPEAIEQVYAHLLNGFEIRYRVPAEQEAAAVKLRVWSDHGAGQAEAAMGMAVESF